MLPDRRTRRSRLTKGAGVRKIGKRYRLARRLMRIGRGWQLVAPHLHYIRSRGLHVAGPLTPLG